MASIYKLVAERRDRNQSIKRKRNNRNINLFKESIDEVQYRRPTLYRNATLRSRTISDQPQVNDLQVPFEPRRGTNELGPMNNFKNQINNVDTKVDALVKKIDELSSSIASLKAELNKK
jgi:hypothetical protein